MSQFFASGGQSVGASALASGFPMNIQDWFPLGLPGLISLQSKGLSRDFSNTTVQKHRFFAALLSLRYICWNAAAAVTSVVSDSVWPHRQQPTRLPCPCNSPGKNTGVGCHFLLQCMRVKSERELPQSCPTFRNPMDCSLPGSSVHGIFQARVLEWCWNESPPKVNVSQWHRATN